MPTPVEFNAVYSAFDSYVEALNRLVGAMRAVGVQTRNVDPFANFAEVVVACKTNGVIQPPANKGFDVLTASQIKIQVKSLRVSSDRPEDNGVTWYNATRTADRATADLIDAHQVAIVVFLDFSPHSLIVFPVEHRDTFPLINVREMKFRHVLSLGKGKDKLASAQVSFADLRRQQ